MLRARTGGAGAGRPATLACAAGETDGCAMMGALAICGSGRTIWRATGCPLRKAVADTAVVAAERLEYWMLFMLDTFVILVMFVTLRTFVTFTRRR